MSASSDSPPKLPAVIPLRPYQVRWVEDASRFKGAVKSARIGFSFATAVEAALDCLARRTTWTVLSASKPQSVEFIQEGVEKIIQAMGAVAQLYQEPFADELGATDILQQRVEFANGSRIIALPANPRTARGYPGNAILDEFGHDEDSYAIWAAITRQVALGHKLRVLSTPNGEQGKFFDLAKQFGLSEGVAPPVNPIRVKDWSWHWIDVHLAVAEGCPISIDAMRDLIQDEDTFQQEFLCVFLKAVGAWLDLAMVSAAEDDGATLALPSHFEPEGFLSLGVDFGRSGDRSCAWLDERIGDVSWTRHVEWQFNMPFFVSEAELAAGKMDQVHWLDPLVKICDRAAMDSTGIGLGPYEYLNAKHPGKVMGVNFGGSIKRLQQGDSELRGRQGLAESVRIKTDMAVRMKRRFEQRQNRIPHSLDIRQEMLSIKREQTSTAVTFDAPRIEVDTAVAGGARRKVFSHAEAFWAKAMADLAAEQQGGDRLEFTFGEERGREFDLNPVGLGLEL